MEPKTDSMKDNKMKKPTKKTKVINQPISTQQSEEQQAKYVAQLEKNPDDMEMVLADAFVRGMRENRYKSTGYAINELTDNGIEAGADQIDVIMDYDGELGTKTKPKALAVIDNGHGMVPLMIRGAMRWGGTTREQARTGLGRFGFGLKSASLSFAFCFTVYSKKTGANWHSVTLDVDKLANGDYRDPETNRTQIPKPEEAKIPDWLVAAELGNGKSVSDLESGTVVLIEKIEEKKLTKKSVTGLSNHLKETFGLTYRNYLNSTQVFVQGEKVEGVDPLFLREDCKWYDVDGVKAESFDTSVLAIKDQETGEIAGELTVRYSLLPPNFHWGSPDIKKPYNPRFSIRDENNGFIICRAGRQIDVTKRIPVEHKKASTHPIPSFSNNTRYIGVEINFPPALDDDFGVENTKQQIVMSERIWSALRSHGFHSALSNIRSKFEKQQKEFAALMAKAKQTGEVVDTAAAIMPAVASGLSTQSGTELKDTSERAQKNFETEVEDKAKKAGLKPEDVAPAVAREHEEKEWVCIRESAKDASFYRFEQSGGQKQLYINTDHPFFKELYMGEGSTPRMRTALELLLYTLGYCEDRSPTETRYMYQRERVQWSTALKEALNRLSEFEPIEVGDDAGFDEPEAANEPEAVASE
tara:strand:- start:1414 stop:3339 length:1926 start_codon:yes stop_codon:yes gene_type:complete